MFTKLRSVLFCNIVIESPAGMMYAMNYVLKNKPNNYPWPSLVVCVIRLGPKPNVSARAGCISSDFTHGEFKV